MQIKHFKSKIFFSSLFLLVCLLPPPLPSGPCPSTAHPPRLDEEAVSAEYSFDPCPSTAHPPKCDEEAVSVESVGDEDEEQAYQKKLPRYPHGLVLCPRQIVVSRVENLLLVILGGGECVDVVLFGLFPACLCPQN